MKTTLCLRLAVPVRLAVVLPWVLVWSGSVWAATATGLIEGRVASDTGSYLGNARISHHWQLHVSRMLFDSHPIAFLQLQVLRSLWMKTHDGHLALYHALCILQRF